MSQFKQDENHVKLTLVYDEAMAELFRKSENEECVLLKDKEGSRLKSIIKSVAELGSNLTNMHTQAMCVLAPANSYEEKMAMSIGLIPMDVRGCVICPACLDTLIFTCKESIEALSDLKEATKVYVK